LKVHLIKSLKEPEDKIGEPSPIIGNKFSHLSLVSRLNEEIIWLSRDTPTYQLIYKVMEGHSGYLK
jgi:hypothetical protein